MFSYILIKGKLIWGLVEKFPARMFLQPLCSYIQCSYCTRINSEGEQHESVYLYGNISSEFTT